MTEGVARVRAAQMCRTEEVARGEPWPETRARLIAERTTRSQARCLREHPCNLLCAGGVHVDTVYTGPDLVRLDGTGGACAAIKRRYEWLYEVEVIDVRPVEAPPPDPQKGQVVLAGGGWLGSEADTFGVWWRIP
jgi:hypothetical protein